MNIHRCVAKYHVMMMGVINGIMRIPYMARLRFMHKWFLVHADGFAKELPKY